MSSFTGNASRSPLQMSSAASLRHSSGPLHSGQTRISSSLGSIGAPAGLGDAGKKEIVELGRQDRIHPQVPHARIGECRAFYGILLGHDDHLGAWKLELLGLERVMVVEGDALGGDTERVEMIEEARRIADPRDGGHGAPSRRERELLRRELLVAREREEALAPERHRELPRRRDRVRPAAVHHGGIDFPQPRHGLAQRTRGKHEAVAETPLAVDHRQLDIARERVVLQAIVAHQHVDLGMRLEKRARRRGPVGRDVDGHARAPRDHHRLVAEVLGGGDVGIHAHHAQRIVLAAGHAAIAARDHPGRPAAVHEDLEDLDHERRLAGTAHRDVADDDDRYSRAPGGQDARAIEESAHRYHQPKEERERGEDQRASAEPLPLGFEPGSHLAPRASRLAYRRVCVVNEMWLYPASRALSITLITAWCVARASALMAITGSFVLFAACLSALAKAWVLPKAVAVPLIAYLPVESTETLSTSGRSVARSADASGRLICSSE